jgi:hypothetical protein
MRIIGVFAQLGNGKDEVANYLVNQLNNEIYSSNEMVKTPWRRVGFADAVKKVFMDSFDVNWAFIEEWKRKDENPPGFDTTIRKGLQQIGDGFRKIQNDVWIRTALRGDNPIVISDGRYINEAKMIKEKGGLNIILWRPGFENNDPNPSESQIRPIVDWFAEYNEEGETKLGFGAATELKCFDYFLKNDGTLEDLYNKIDEFVIPYLKEKGLK